jgi:hypothetical protein
MPVRRAAEHPVALATPSTIIARITIAGIITPRSIGRRYTPITSLIGKLGGAFEGMLWPNKSDPSCPPCEPSPAKFSRWTGGYEWELPGTPSGRRMWPVMRMSFPIRL